MNEISNPAKYYKKKQKYVAIHEISKLSNKFKETTIYQTIFRIGTELSILKNILAFNMSFLLSEKLPKIMYGQSKL